MHDENPYSSPQANLATEVAVHDFRLGGRGERLGAALIDTFIQVPLSLPLLYAFGYFDQILSGVQPSLPTRLLASALGFVLFVLVQGYPLSKYGQTWGKKLMKLKIVDLEGRLPKFARLLGLRYATTQAAALIPVLGTLYILTDTLFIFREDKRCIHDHIAGTRVVVAD